MVNASRRLVGPVLVLLGAVYVAWRGFGVQTMGDYPSWFAPAMNALLDGHLAAFFHQLPQDGAGGSVLLRAPGALAGKLLVGGQLATFRFGALESVLAVGALGLWLARDMRAAGRPAMARTTVIAMCVIVPALLDAILFGHPEEPLGAALCVSAVLLAGAERPTLAGIALGLAVIDKPWGVLAILPALLAAPRGRARIAIVAGGIAAIWFAAAYVVAPETFTKSFSAGVGSSVAHPEELWWPLAHLAGPRGAPFDALPGIIASHAREAAVVVAACLALLLARRRDRCTDDCLALLALAFLLRCLLDPSNHVYYHVPFVIALIALEGRSRGAPVIALFATGTIWLVFHTISGIAGTGVQFVAYMTATLPVAAILLGVVLGWEGRSGATVPARPAAA
jgi:hypothetical protein